MNMVLTFALVFSFGCTSLGPSVGHVSEVASTTEEDQQQEEPLEHSHAHEHESEDDGLVSSIVSSTTSGEEHTHEHDHDAEHPHDHSEGGVSSVISSTTSGDEEDDEEEGWFSSIFSSTTSDDEQEEEGGEDRSFYIPWLSEEAFIPRRIGFRHIAYGLMPFFPSDEAFPQAWSEGVFAPPIVKELKEKSPLPFYRSHVDFRTHFVLAAFNVNGKYGQGIKIGKVIESGVINLDVVVATTPDYCRVRQRTYNSQSFHLIAIKRADVRDLSKPVRIRTVYKKAHCQPSTTVAHNAGSRVRVRPYLLAPYTEKPQLSPKAFIFADKWGRWQGFYRKRCPGCKVPPLPHSYPWGHKLIAVQDSAPAVPNVGIRKLEVDPVRKVSGRIVLPVRRTVHMCSGGSDSANMVAVLLEKDDVSSLDVNQAIWPLPPFIPEDQIPCPEEVAG